MPRSHRPIATVKWLVSLINPPPLSKLSNRQKVSRVFVFTFSLVMICILSSMLAAVGIFALQKIGHLFDGVAVLAGDILIIFISMVVNALCIMVLLKIKAADQKMIPPEEPPV